MLDLLLNYEVFIIVSLLVLSFLLLRINFFSSLVLALVLSGFLHKELFSLYIWDMLPIRIWMGAFLLNALYEFFSFNRFSFKFLPYLKDPFILINILVVFSRLFSTVNSLNLGISLFLNLFFITVTVFIITIYIKVSGEDLLKLFKTYTVYGTFLCLITFVQLYAYYQYSFLFGAILNIAGGTIDFPSFQPTYEFFTEALKIIVMTRVGSIFWDVNHFGGFLAGMLLPLFVFFLNSKEKKEKIFLGFACVIFLTTLFLTNSRSAWLFAGVEILIFGLIVFYYKFGKKGIVISLLTLSLVSGILFLMYQDKDSMFRAKVRSYFHYRLDSFDSHMLLLQGAVEVFNKFPLLGGGTGSFFEHFKTTTISDEFLKRDPAGLTVRVPAHSIWGEFLSESGAFGLISFIILVLFMLGIYFYALNHFKNYQDYLLISSFIATNLGFLIAGIFYSYNSEFFYILFLFPIIITLKKFNIDFRKVLEYYHQKTIYTFCLLFLICASLILWNLGNHKFVPYDEAIYAKVAKNVYETGDYFSLYWRNTQNNWFEKPPLFFALTSMSFHLFGVSEFSAKFVSAFFALLTLIVIYKFGKSLGSSVIGYFAMIVLTLNTSYLYYSRMAMLDVTLTFFILTGIYFYYQGFIKSKTYFYFLSGLMLGLAVLTKSLVGLLPFFGFGLFGIILIVLKKDSLLNQLKKLLLVFGTTFVIAAPWHFYMYYLHSDSFLNSYFGYHLFERFSTEIEDKGEVWYWYYIVIRNTMRIWFLFLIVGLIFMFYRMYKSKISLETLSYIFLICLSLVIFVAFSVSSSKLKWYIMPIYPLTSLVVGVFLYQLKMYLEKKSKSLVVGLFFLFVSVVSGIGYLYTIREMVYTSDLTLRIVSLIQLNNTLKEKDHLITYFDKVEEPLAIYYSDKNYQIVLWVGLRDNIKNFYNTHQGSSFVSFLTSQSRFKNLQELGFPVEKISENQDFVLGRISK